MNRTIIKTEGLVKKYSRYKKTEGIKGSIVSLWKRDYEEKLAVKHIDMTLYFFGVIGIPGKVKSGELDLYLTKPVSPLFRLTFENISPGSISLILMSICIIAYGVSILEMQLTVIQIFIYLFGGSVR